MEAAKSGWRGWIGLPLSSCWGVAAVCFVAEVWWQGSGKGEHDEGEKRGDAKRVRPAGFGAGEQTDAGEKAADGHANKQAGCRGCDDAPSDRGCGRVVVVAEAAAEDELEEEGQRGKEDGAA